MDASFYGGCNDMASLLGNSANNSFCWLPSSSSSNGTMRNFDVQQPQLGGLLVGKRKRHDGLLARTSNGNDTSKEELEKKRLTPDQVKYLERTFEEENMLEPGKKAELAKQLGLHPRQIAIWFQNKRARYKSKQIEIEFDTLRENYEHLKVDYDSLNMEKQQLQNEIETLKNKLAEKEKNETNSKLHILPHLEDENIEAYGNVGKIGLRGRVVMSSIVQAKCLHCKDENTPTPVHVEASSNNFMSNQDHQVVFSQADEEHKMINNNLLMPQYPPTYDNFLNGHEDVNHDPNADSCNFSTVEDETFWSTKLY